ncbi:hypothetical protein [Paraburkholderia ferrariae]|uniref:hypothetical protein n=1 Tax=Paraburkholderia ferrariae TaxID=386056 RepID=UPI0012EC55D6|nr:hypothetical protein [Paraburkholderia ferrariae]
MNPPTSGMAGRAPLARLFGRTAAFLSDRSAFVLMLLLLEAGLVLGFVQAAHDLHAAGAGAPALTRGAAAASCADAAVVFQRNATEQDISLLLTQYGASIVYGPDENGAYLVRVGAADFKAVALQGLHDAPAVADMHIERICR